MPAEDTIAEILKAAEALVVRLRQFSGESLKRNLSDAQLEEVISRLRVQGVWGASNDTTLGSMVAGGGYSRTDAFQALTAGSAPVLAVVDAVLAGEPAATIVNPDEIAPTPPDPEPPKPRRRGRGRPRKKSEPDPESIPGPDEE